MNVLVFVDQHNGQIVKSSLEAISYGAAVAGAGGGSCVAYAFGGVTTEALAGLGVYGAQKVLHNAGAAFDPMSLATSIAAAAKGENAELVVFSHDDNGKAIAPCAAALLEAGHVAGALALPDTSNGFVVRKAVFSGKAFANCRIATPVKVISLLPNSIQVTTTGANAQVEAVNTSDAVRTKVEDFKQKGGEGINLTEAELVVSAGRGLKGPENWGMVEELARLLGAATACSRPVADVGWRPHHEHVGQTGIAIRPNLYIAIGISGAIQHLAGVNGSKVIVVINTDADAPFFKAATYGVLGDAFEVVPKLLEAIKKFKSAA
ncbi:MAG: electron transfer flavoprotein subunit alpha/FixB family protein [Flavobacteriales bacterium]|nr:electron transfer flavoprotein subunit alpha/FixB family protein [Flavobacteriales bacterium]